MKKEIGFILLLVILLISGCGRPAMPNPADSASQEPPVETPPSNAELQKPQPVGIPKPDHVVIVVEENHSFDKVMDNASAPYIHSLAKQGVLFTQSYGIGHPSQPNYLILFSGSDQGVKNDSCGHQFTTPNLASELIKAHYTFAGYSEDLPEAGSTACSNKKYGRKHSPWVNFTNVPKETNLPLDRFPSDFSQLPTVSFVIPNMNNDMHDGSIQTADSWLKKHMDPYVQWVQTHNSLLIVTWDEDDFSKSNRIPTIFVGPMIKPGTNDQHITHLDVLRTIEEMYGLSFVGDSRSVSGIKGIWKP